MITLPVILPTNVYKHNRAVCVFRCVVEVLERVPFLRAFRAVLAMVRPVLWELPVTIFPGVETSV